MMAILDAVRDALVSLALAWIGVVVEPAPPAQPAPSKQAAAICAKKGGGAAACAAHAPGFDAQLCAEQR